MDPKYPDITVTLVGEDGNAFTVIGLVTRAMKKAGLTTEQVAEFRNEAMAGSYDHLLQTCFKYVEVQ